jgi:16S rRNA (guanine(527)-N(7))-methyltransferase RsmG
VKQTRQGRYDLSRETSDRIAAFSEVLLRWNARINLISRGDESRVFERHISDALQLRQLIPARLQRAIDLGSGAGFPGLVLAITTGVHFDLIEADRRKATFLREAIRITNASATVYCVRVEHMSALPANLITARAFASLSRTLDLAHRFLAPGGVLLLPKGKSAEQELTEASARWNMTIEKFPSKTDPGATILRLSEVTRG